MHSEYNLPKANIEVTGVMNDGRPFRLNTKGDVVIRTKKDPWENDYHEFSMYEAHSFVVEKPKSFELVADLEYDQLKDAVFTIQIDKQTVTKSVTADFAPGVDASALRKRLGVPPEFKMKFKENQTRVVFTWEEEI